MHGRNRLSCFLSVAALSGLSLSMGSSGTKDPSFDGGFVSVFPESASSITAMAVNSYDSLNRLIVAGRSGNSWSIVRFLTSGPYAGHPDETFGTAGRALLFSSSGYRWVNDVAVDPLDRIVVTGYVGYPDTMKLYVVRLNEDGTKDTSFSGDGQVELSLDKGVIGKAVEIQDDGKIIVSGDVLNKNAYRYILLARFTENGDLDTQAFGTPNSPKDIKAGKPPYKGYMTDEFNSRQGEGVFSGVMKLQGSNILVGGYIGFSSSGEPANGWTILRYTEHGRDTSFGTNGYINPTGYGRFDRLQAMGLALQNGKILVGGRAWVNAFGGDYDAIVVRYYGDDGDLDTSFGSTDPKAGFAVSDIPVQDQGGQISVQSDNKIVIADILDLGGIWKYAAFRFLEDGLHDDSFGQSVSPYPGLSEPLSDPDATGGWCTSLVLDNNGDIYVGGYSSIGGLSYMSVAKFFK